MNMPSTDRLPIHINEEPRSVPCDATLLSVLREMSHADGKKVSVALNGVMVRSADWADQHLCPDDHLMVIEAGR